MKADNRRILELRTGETGPSRLPRPTNSPSLRPAPPQPTRPAPSGPVPVTVENPKVDLLSIGDGPTGPEHAPEA